MDEFLRILANEIVNPLIVLMFAVALLVFTFGVFEYVRNSDSPEDRKKGSNHILYGLIGLTIMVSAFTIIQIALGTLGF